MKLSRLFVRAAVLLTVIVFPQFIPPTAAQAAPGDLLFTSGGASNVYGLGVDTSGNIYVPDRYQVKVYDSSGAFVKSLGFTPPLPCSTMHLR